MAAAGRAGTRPERAIGEGVSRTALLIAAARAVESTRPDAVAVDGYAARFVRAEPSAASWPLRFEDVPGGDANPLWSGDARYFGLRTRVFDDHLLEVARAGTRQVVLVAAGLDARALRLDWPPGTAVFEVDREHVLGFKQRVLDDAGAHPTARRVPVPTDLEADWPSALLAAGLSPDQPTAWLVEGLSMYLSRAALRALLADLTRLSAPASTLALEVKPSSHSPHDPLAPFYTEARAVADVDLPALFDHDPRPNSEEDLVLLGWTATSRRATEYAEPHGQATPTPDGAFGDNTFVFAQKPTVPLPRPTQPRSPRRSGNR
ncbi:MULTISPECIES: SAM-dependent methyltransferase [Actinosynnema]|uniref:SAM-dependent methyltransferase n=1 Tax=Actinosynnema TaxID=40566 RepID=UPI0020A441BC|nr:SAM-dependent methyltransferase [Actinosynnema pretiosum]MCP2096610.1 methyltransferase, TIGR00027 family [Actinosynnema pretiosum]